MAPHILFVEDSADDAELARWHISKAGLQFTWTLVWTERELVNELAQGPDLIISDFEIPGFDGWEALRMARALAPEVPFIFHSGTIGEERCRRALSLGAFGCVDKQRVDVLVAVVSKALQAA